MCAESNKCSKIVSKNAMGDNYVIEGNRRTWYTEDGQRYVECDPQYQGPVWRVSGEMMCADGYKSNGWLF